VPTENQKNKEIQSFSDTNSHDRPALVIVQQYSCFHPNAANTAVLRPLSWSSLSSHHSTPANRLHSVPWKSEDAG
jgi:hypothetical protein